MNPYFNQKTLLTLAILAAAPSAFAQTVMRYEFVGLSRVPADSVQEVLPNVGADLTEADLAQTINNLYATEQFAKVDGTITNGVATYYFIERPIIADIEFSGNKLIPKKGLEDGLKQAGLARGMVLKQSTLTGVKNELLQQYANLGYYNTDIEVKQTLLDGNRVKLAVEFKEGKVARVVDINILGNEQLSDETLKDALLLKEPNWNFLSKADKFAQAKFAQSLAALRLAYLNAGFVRYELQNASLNLSPNKAKVAVEISVKEGDRYRFGNTTFSGDRRYSNELLNSKIAYQADQQFTQRQLEQTSEAIIAIYGDAGFYNAQIRPVLHINDASKTVDVEYVIESGRPVYVRRINFSGNIKTKDEVLRREMRQLEGALANSIDLQLSRMRLMRTGYFKEVQIDTVPVAGAPDLLDVNVVVEEQPSGSSTIAAGYSQSGGVTFQLDLSQNNFMGTGNKMNAAFSRSETRESYNLGYTDPYFTKNGVSQSLAGYYRKTKLDKKNISNYVMDSLGASLSYSYPIDEHQRISGGINLDSTDVNGGRNMALANVQQLLDDGGTADYTGGVGSFHKKYRGSNAILGYTYSSLDKPIFPTKGVSHDVDLTIGLGDKNYQKITYTGNYYQPLSQKGADGLIARAYAKLGYGNNLPFYERYYAGGYGSVRGFDASTLGPKSPSYQGYLEHIGGNALATFGAELILPLPFKGDWTDQVRPVLFAEGGQVFDTTGLADKTVNLATYGGQNFTTALATKDKSLRYSAGVGATWYTPIGPLSISYAKPFGEKAGDKTEKVQFQIGSVF